MSPPQNAAWNFAVSRPGRVDEFGMAGIEQVASRQAELQAGLDAPADARIQRT